MLPTTIVQLSCEKITNLKKTECCIGDVHLRRIVGLVHLGKIGTNKRQVSDQANGIVYPKLH